MAALDDFFAFARRRHKIYLDRQAGKPFPWTGDRILTDFRFTNVFRELDRTTLWYAGNVRERYPVEELILATVVFRWFNRIRTGDAIFNDHGPKGARAVGNAWDEYRESGWTDTSPVKREITRHCGAGPYVTGSYIIKTVDGMDKLSGVLDAIDKFAMMSNFGLKTDIMKSRQHSLQETWEWLRQFPMQGDFTAYEVITDLRHTSLLDRAPDIMTWANPGPGAQRGLNRIHGRPIDGTHPKTQLIREMRDILIDSADSRYWPANRCNLSRCEDCHGSPGCTNGWPALEMRDVEHTLCEFDKYERARLGQGRPRGRFTEGRGDT